MMQYSFTAGDALWYENPRVSGFGAQKADPKVCLNCVEMKESCSFCENNTPEMLPCMIV